MGRSHVIKPLLDAVYPEVDYGQGVFLYDAEGKEYLDGCAGAVTACLGHGLPEIVAAMAAQAGRVAFSYRGQFTNRPAETLATELVRLAPGDFDGVFFVNSGSEALETALKIAVQYWHEQGQRGKTLVLARRMSYHGITLGALSMSGHLARRRWFAPLLNELAVVAPPYCYRCPLGKRYPDCALACADDLETAIRRVGPERVAAFVAEPFIGAAGGAVGAPPGYFERIRAICDRHGILLVADEVMTGIGRTGRMFAVEHYGLQPDMIAVGKGLSAGYTPLAATLVHSRVLRALRDGSRQVMSGHTFSANPLSCAVGQAVLSYVQEHNLVPRAAELGVYLKDQLSILQRRHPMVGDVRGAGLLWGLELVADAALRRPFATEQQVTARLVAAAQRHGLLVYPALAGVDVAGGDAVLIAPPLTITRAEIDILLQRLDAALTAVHAEPAAGRSPLP